MFAFILLTLVAAPPENPLKAPEGWTSESIQLPPSFAPKMSLKGWEHVKFSPQMFDPESERFFSYVVCFETNRKKKMEPKVFGDQLLIYYRGLASTVSGGKVETGKFRWEWLEQKKPTEVKRGKLHWTEPFRTNKPQTLFIESRSWMHDDQLHIFMCVSSADWKHAVWKDLRRIRDQYVKKSDTAAAK